VLLDLGPDPIYIKIAREALELHDLGWSKRKIASHYGVDDKTAAKALRVACDQAGLPVRRGWPTGVRKYQRIATRALELQERGLGVAAIAHELAVSPPTVRKALAFARDKSAKGGA
jgi:prolyl-tRNA editing enzyme YbaK/EbsC (Cys-tRNA(Pro) deacylase)